MLADRAHDHDPQAWAEYQRLLALDTLAPLSTEHDALDDPAPDDPAPDDPAAGGPAHEDRGEPTTASAGDWHNEDRVVRDHRADEAALEGRNRDDGPVTDTQGRWWASTGAETAEAAGTCDPANALVTEHPDDPERLRRRIEDLRAQLAARDQRSLEGEDEQRREQLARWHADDRSCCAEIDAGHETGDDSGGELGWGR